jgi:hypothetical protein
MDSLTRRLRNWRRDFLVHHKKGTTISKVLEEVIAANNGYASDFGDKANLPLLPGRRFAILLEKQ